MKYVIFLLFLFPVVLFAQPEHRVAVSGKTIEFREIDQLMIIGHNEKDLKISRGGDADNHVDEKAAGLRKISASGKSDNTGFGLSAQGFDDKVVVEQLGRAEGLIVVHVPNDAVVKVIQSTHRGRGLKVDNFKGELDISMHYHQVELTNAYGPLAVNTIYGNIVATFSQGPPTNDIRLHSTYQEVDVTLPRNTAANLRLSTSYGSMYTDFDINAKTKPAPTAEDKKEQAQYSPKIPDDHSRPDENSGLTGTINGGGKLISLNATYKNVYLRMLK